MHRHYYPIIIGALLLSGCNLNKESSLVSSSSPISVDNTLTDEILSKMGQGYSTRGIFKTGTDTLGYTYNYVETASKPREFTATVYESASENPQMDTINNEMHYAAHLQMAISCLCEVELGLDNNIHYYPLVSTSNTYVPWDVSGYGNSFSLLNVDDFEKGETDNLYKLKLGDKALNTFYSSVGAQFTATMGYDLDSFVIEMNNGLPDKFHIVFEPISTSYGVYKSEIEGVFTGFGEDVIAPITKAEGQEDAFLQTTLDKLKKQNYHLKVELSNRIYEADIEDGKTILYDVLSKKNVKTGAYGYYQKGDGIVQAVLKLNDKVYPDGDLLSGYMNNILPSFNISSVFFDKSNNDGVTTYTLKDNHGCKIYSNDYGTLGGGNAGTLIIEVKDEEVVVTNKLRLTEEKYTYSNIGGVKGLLDSLQPNADDATWNDIISNQVAESEILYRSISAEQLDYIPTIGGNYSYIVLDASYNPKKPVFMLALNDYNEGETLQVQYEAKLVDNGYVLQDEEGKNGGNFYIKEVNINGTPTKIGVEVLLALEFFKTIQFLIYPTIL